MLSRQETRPKQQGASRRRRPARPKKRKRKIDAWQAFQRAQGAGTKVGRGSTSRLSNMYRALSPEQFRYYKDIATAANVARNAGHRPFGPRKRKARVIVDGSNRIESLSLMAKRRARAEASARSKALLIKQKKKVGGKEVIRAALGSGGCVLSGHISILHLEAWSVQRVGDFGTSFCHGQGTRAGRAFHRSMFSVLELGNGWMSRISDSLQRLQSTV